MVNFLGPEKGSEINGIFDRIRDDEVADIWLNEIKVSRERFSRMGEKGNFWTMGGTGPCGPFARGALRQRSARIHPLVFTSLQLVAGAIARVRQTSHFPVSRAALRQALPQSLPVLPLLQQRQPPA